MDYADVELGEIFGGAAPPAASKGNTWEQANRDVRIGFIRKVYGLLSAQLLATVVVCACCVKIPVVTNLVIAMPALNLVNAFAGLALLIALHCCKHQYPLNLKLLAAWTLSIAFGLGFTCALYTVMGMATIVMQAAGTTFVVFASLTAFTFQSKSDFSFLGASLHAGLCCLMLWGFLGWVFGFSIGLAYSVLGALIFSGYIVFDTYLLVHKHSIDDYVLATIELYLDIVNLFLFILRILAKLSKKSDN
jgi:FtsH-binding integral membrane protein